MTPSVDYDVIVIGLGAVGAAAAWQLARSGARTLGLDRYAPPHAAGSTHGDTRITRLAVGEGPAYAPLVRRSHELWRTVEEQTEYSLLHLTGGLVIGTADPPTEEAPGFLTRTVAVARALGIAHEPLDSAELRRRYPQFQTSGAETGYYEPSAGFVRPEAAVAAQLELAHRHRARLQTDERVLGVEPRTDHVRVATDRRTYRADTAILAAGPWISQFLPEHRRLFRVFRQVLYWFELIDEGAFTSYEQLPVFLWPVDGVAGFGLYGFPALDGPRGGVKVATEQFLVESAPDDPPAPVAADEVEAMYQTLVADRLPGLGPRAVRAVACRYTVTPDHGFVVDRHPDHDRIIIASPCSGHGFKHSAAIGEAVAQLATRRTSDLDLSPFSFDRPTLHGARSPTHGV